MKARYIQRGSVLDFRPAQDVAAGEIVKLGSLIGIVLNSIPAGTLGTIAVSGVFSVIKAPECEIMCGQSVHWNSAAECASAENGPVIGLAVEDAAAGQHDVKVLLNYSGNDSKAEWVVL